MFPEPSLFCFKVALSLSFIPGLVFDLFLSFTLPFQIVLSQSVYVCVCVGGITDSVPPKGPSFSTPITQMGGTTPGEWEKCESV